MQFGSKFVVKIPREGKGEVFKCRTYARISPYVQTLTVLGLMSQGIDYYATESTSAKAIASKVIGATVIKSLSIILSLAFVSERSAYWYLTSSSTILLSMFPYLRVFGMLLLASSGL